jgi:hypothetical protein
MKGGGRRGVRAGGERETCRERDSFNIYIYDAKIKFTS